MLRGSELPTPIASNLSERVFACPEPNDATEASFRKKVAVNSRVLVVGIDSKSTAIGRISQGEVKLDSRICGFIYVSKCCSIRRSERFSFSFRVDPIVRRPDLNLFGRHKLLSRFVLAYSRSTLYAFSAKSRSKSPEELSRPRSLLQKLTPGAPCNS